MTQSKAAARALKFFATKSKLSTGEKNRRFQGTINSMTHMRRCSNQSAGVQE